jgi:hypothetical protein
MPWKPPFRQYECKLIRNSSKYFLSQGKRKVNKHFEKIPNSFIVDFELLFSAEYATIREKL